MEWMSTQRKVLCLLLITSVFSTCKYFSYSLFLLQIKSSMFRKTKVHIDNTSS